MEFLGKGRSRSAGCSKIRRRIVPPKIGLALGKLKLPARPARSRDRFRRTAPETLVNRVCVLLPGRLNSSGIKQGNLGLACDRNSNRMLPSCFPTAWADCTIARISRRKLVLSGLPLSSQIIPEEIFTSKSLEGEVRSPSSDPNCVHSRRNTFDSA